MMDRDARAHTHRMYSMYNMYGMYVMYVCICQVCMYVVCMECKHDVYGMVCMYANIECSMYGMHCMYGIHCMYGMYLCLVYAQTRRGRVQQIFPIALVAPGKLIQTSTHMT